MKFYLKRVKGCDWSKNVEFGKDFKLISKVPLRHSLEKKDLVHLLPFEVDSCDVEDYTLEPEDHKEPLWEGTVSDALSIAAGLTKATVTQQFTSVQVTRMGKVIVETDSGEYWHGAFRLSCISWLYFPTVTTLNNVVNRYRS